MWIPNIDVDPDADLPISKSGPAFANLSRKLVIGKWESYNYEEESLRGVDLFKMNKRNPLETVTRNATFANPRIRIFNADAII